MLQYDYYDKYKDRKQFKKEELQSLGLTEDAIRPFAGKETDKMFTNVDVDAFIRSTVNNVKVPHRSLSEKIRAQLDNLGYLTITDDCYSNMAAVVNLDTRFSPRLRLYSLKNGTTHECKIPKWVFNMNKLDVGDIVKIKSTTQKPRVRKNEKTCKWDPIPNTTELWITDYVRLDL